MPQVQGCFRIHPGKPSYGGQVQSTEDPRLSGDGGGRDDQAIQFTEFPHEIEVRKDEIVSMEREEPHQAEFFTVDPISMPTAGDQAQDYDGTQTNKNVNTISVNVETPQPMPTQFFPVMVGNGLPGLSPQWGGGNQPNFFQQSPMSNQVQPQAQAPQSLPSSLPVTSATVFSPPAATQSMTTVSSTPVSSFGSAPMSPTPASAYPSMNPAPTSYPPSVQPYSQPPAAAMQPTVSSTSPTVSSPPVASISPMAASPMAMMIPSGGGSRVADAAPQILPSTSTATKVSPTATATPVSTSSSSPSAGGAVVARPRVVTPQPMGGSSLSNAAFKGFTRSAAYPTLYPSRTLRAAPKVGSVGRAGTLTSATSVKSPTIGRSAVSTTNPLSGLLP